MSFYKQIFTSKNVLLIFLQKIVLCDINSEAFVGRSLTALLFGTTK